MGWRVVELLKSWRSSRRLGGAAVRVVARRAAGVEVAMALSRARREARARRWGLALARSLAPWGAGWMALGLAGLAAALLAGRVLRFAIVAPAACALAAGCLAAAAPFALGRALRARLGACGLRWKPLDAAVNYAGDLSWVETPLIWAEGRWQSLEGRWILVEPCAALAALGEALMLAAALRPALATGAVSRLAGLNPWLCAEATRGHLGELGKDLGPEATGGPNVRGGPLRSGGPILARDPGLAPWVRRRVGIFGCLCAGRGALPWERPVEVIEKMAGGGHGAQAAALAVAWLAWELSLRESMELSEELEAAAPRSMRAKARRL